MQNTIKRILVMVLSLTLIFSLTVPAFAADSVDFAVTLSQAEYTISEEKQSFTMTITASEAISVDQFSGYITWDSALTLVSIEAGEEKIGSLNTQGTSTTSGAFMWYSGDADVENVTNILRANFEIPANTAGTYEVGFSNLKVTKEYTMTTIVQNASASATLTITEPSSGGEGGSTTSDAYTAELSSAASAVKVGETVTVDVKVGGTSKEFASSELALSYTGLTYVSGSAVVADGQADIVNNNGGISIIDHGNSLTWEDNASATAYTFTFTVNSITSASGTASVTLNSAKFSTDENALSQNLTVATGTPAVKEFTVTPADLSVTLGDGLSGSGTVVYGGTYTFEATDKNYTYTVTVNGEDVAVSTGDGTWKIENVTEALNIVITSQTPKKHNVTYSNADHIEGTPVAQATYDVPYTFTLKENVPAGTTAGVTYDVESIVYTGTEDAVTYTKNGQTVTIDGKLLTAPITITTKATTVAANQFNVTVEGDSGVTANPSVVEKNGDVVLTLTPVAGYKYTVTVNGTAINDSEWTTNADGTKTYTIEDVTAAVTVKVTREVDKDAMTVTVNNYLALNDLTMYLVRVTGALAEGEVYTYDGAKMYWSEEYKAYAYLVVNDADTALTADAAKEALSIAPGAAEATIVYDGNVNKADESTVDANDAQLVYNMYQTKAYSDFTAASMEKFLRADIETDGEVNVDDAAKIIRIIKGVTN